MPKTTPEDLTFHTRFDRRAHGCLPLFVIGVFLAVLTVIWLVPVKKPEPLRPLGIGEVMRESDALTELIVRENSPLPLLQPRAIDPDFDEVDRMPLRRELAPAPAPPARLFPAAPDSAVLDAESLLELPPAPAAEPGKEVSP